MGEPEGSTRALMRKNCPFVKLRAVKTVGQKPGAQTLAVRHGWSRSSRKKLILYCGSNKYLYKIHKIGGPNSAKRHRYSLKKVELEVHLPLG
ncbi:hypothetical protein Zmor_018533 [Zophobas morio]|uniref:Uncharacterized protein n=1 Tax=Zophobas morio TaxID=2755281 RepID=A0AA38MDY1_9CUCU|nr:hypothetical protein Zmor_018533 [Zophobas morio]